MSNDSKKDIEKKTESSKQQAIEEAGKGKDSGDKTMHTVNPFTGTQVNITPEDLEGIEKKIEADTERD